MSNSTLVDFKTWLNSGGNPNWLPERRQGRIKSIAIWLGELFDGDDGRHEFLKWAFGTPSTKDLGDRQLSRLWEWLGVSKDDDSGEWIIRAKCYTTAGIVKRALQIEAGQEELL